MNEAFSPPKCWRLKSLQQSSGWHAIGANHVSSSRRWGRWRLLLVLPYFTEKLRTDSNRDLTPLIRYNPMQWLLIRQIKTQRQSKKSRFSRLWYSWTIHVFKQAQVSLVITLHLRLLQCKWSRFVTACAQQMGMSAVAKWLCSARSGTCELETIVCAYK